MVARPISGLPISDDFQRRAKPAGRSLGAVSGRGRPRSGGMVPVKSHPHTSIRAKPSVLTCGIPLFECPLIRFQTASNAEIAQLVRAPDCESGGYGFDPRSRYQFTLWGQPLPSPCLAKTGFQTSPRKLALDGFYRAKHALSPNATTPLLLASFESETRKGNEVNRPITLLHHEQPRPTGNPEGLSRSAA